MTWSLIFCVRIEQSTYEHLNMHLDPLVLPTSSYWIVRVSLRAYCLILCPL